MTKNQLGSGAKSLPGNLFGILFWGGVTVCCPTLSAFAGVSANKMSAVQQDNKTVSIQGVVLDGQGEPLIGATILVKGTKVGAATDLDGRFKLDAAKGQVLVISYIGMITKEVSVTDMKEMRIVLDSDNKLLDEVVVTGYQTLSKERSTGSFAKVSAEKLEMKRMDNLSSMLEGQVAGYVDGKIRGVTTMNAVANPMVVIDGFPVENTTMDRIGQTTENMPDLNPEDIESVTVL